MGDPPSSHSRQGAGGGPRVLPTRGLLLPHLLLFELSIPQSWRVGVPLVS